MLCDVDAQGRFGTTLIVLTSTRLLRLPARPDGSEAAHADAAHAPLSANDWLLPEVTRLEARDRGGLGRVDLFGPAGRLDGWHFTVGNMPAANGLIEHFEHLQRGTVRLADDRPDDGQPSAPLTERASPRALFRLWQFARPQAALIVLGFVLSVLATFAGLIPPYLTMPLMDEILVPYQMQIDAASTPTQVAAVQEAARSRFSAVPYFLLALAGAAVAAWLLSWAQGAVLARVSERISAELRTRSYAHLHTLSLEYFGGRRTGDLISRISTDSDRLCAFLSDSLVDFAADVLLIIGTAAVLISINWNLALVTLLPFPLTVWLMYRTRDRLQAGFQQGSRAWAQMTNILADAIPGIRVVKAFAQEQREIERFRTANRHIVQANDRVNGVWTFFWPLIALLNQFGLLVVWACGIWLVYRSQVTVGVLTAFLAYIGRFYGRLESMSRIINASQRAAASAQRIFDVLDRVPSVAEPTSPVHPGRLQGSVEFRNVSFRYGNRLVIDSLNFSIEPGEVIGLVGHTGAGKSTLVNLVCRFFDVAEGQLLIDGTDVRAFPIEEYRRNVGIVLQDPFLFYGTIAENIAYGRPDATRDEIIAAAQAARAHDFILRLSDGYDSLVGERGQSLSGGERQRISIARALIIDPRILILDEATSAVDTQTEREIQAALQNLIQGRTTIAIAHRLSTLRRANRIVVLDRGQIVEVGPHAELLENNGPYARLYEAQVQAAEALESNFPLGVNP